MPSKRSVAVSCLAALALAGCGPSGPAANPNTKVTVVDIDKLPSGPSPKIGWIDANGTLHIRSKTVPLGNDVFDVAVLGRRIVVKALTESSDNEVQVRDLSGDITARYPHSDGRLVTNARRNVVAWTGAGGVVWVLQAGHDAAVDLTHPSGDAAADTIGVTGKDCFGGPEEVRGGGCSVYFTVQRGDKSVPMVVSSHGFSERIGSRLDELIDVSPDGSLVGIRSASSRHPCARYESPTTAKVMKSYERCDFLPGEFSPDGARLTAYGPIVTEGVATDVITVRNSRSGKKLLTMQSPKGKVSLYRVAWEDNAHLLATVDQDEGSWAIVRIGLDGKANVAVGPRKGSFSGLADALTVQP